MGYKDVFLLRLRGEIKRMTRKSLLFSLLKEELGKLGYWKNKARGNPAKGYTKSSHKFGVNGTF